MANAAAGAGVNVTFGLNAGQLGADGTKSLTARITTNPQPAAPAAAVPAFTSGPLTFTLDTADPTVTNITPPPNGVYYEGQNLDFTVTFSSPVNITGTPTLPINIGGTVRNASFLATVANPVTSATFRYQIAAADVNDNNGITFSGPINFPGGATIADLAGNALNPAFGGSGTGVIVVASAPAATAQIIGVVPNTQIVEAVSTLTLQLRDALGNPVGFPSGNPGIGLVGLDDFQLTRNGIPVDLSGARITNAVAGANAYADYIVSDLEGATNAPGQYRMTFADAAVSLQVGTVEWVKSQPTPSELTALLTPLPSDPTPTTPRNTPVDTVQITFRDNDGNPLFVTGVNTIVTGAAIGNNGAGQFGLFLNGQEIGFPNGATVAGSGSTYFINGLSGVTNQAGGYLLVVRDLGGITTTGGGASLIAEYGAAWEYQDPTTVQQVVLVGGNPATPTYFRQGDVLIFQATFSSIVRVGVGGVALPSLTLNIGGQSRTATYQGGAGTNTLTFSYPIAATDLDIDGIEVISTLAGGDVYL